MRCLNKNKVKLWYATYIGDTEILSNNIPTGSYTVSYSNPICIKANVSAAVGTADTQLFGVNLNYDKTIVTCDTDLPIDETTVLWIDTAPVIDADGATNTPYDYKVVRVAKSLNSVSYAVSKVSVS